MNEGHYVRVEAGLGRTWFLKIAEWAEVSGCGYVEHHSGGWLDDVVHLCEPHLRFDRREDALSYILVFGGTYTTTPPEQEPKLKLMDE